MMLAEDLQEFDGRGIIVEMRHPGRGGGDSITGEDEQTHPQERERGGQRATGGQGPDQGSRLRMAAGGDEGLDVARTGVGRRDGRIGSGHAANGSSGRFEFEVNPNGSRKGVRLQGVVPGWEIRAADGPAYGVGTVLHIVGRWATGLGLRPKRR
jgi:hypothetical protein